MNYFQEILNRAMRQCHETYSSLFDYIYPFTTENISGYINEFTLENRSLLTVGSSSDQVLNAILYGCENVTLLDINPYTKFYYYLKVACILTLNKEEYLEFLRYYNYPKVFKDNKNCFNIEIFKSKEKTSACVKIKFFKILKFIKKTNNQNIYQNQHHQMNIKA